MDKETKEPSADKVEKVNQPKGAPIAPSSSPGNVSRETLSHQWQENSPAINTNALAGYGDQKNIVSDLEEQKKKAEEKPVEKVKPALSEEEHERRTKLDVSNPLYINPSLDHHGVTAKTK